MVSFTHRINLSHYLKISYTCVCDYLTTHELNLSVFRLITHCFDYCSFIVGLEIRWLKFSIIALVYQVTLATWDFCIPI